MWVTLNDLELEAVEVRQGAEWLADSTRKYVEGVKVEEGGGGLRTPGSGAGGGGRRRRRPSMVRARTAPRGGSVRRRLRKEVEEVVEEEEDEVEEDEEEVDWKTELSVSSSALEHVIREKERLQEELKRLKESVEEQAEVSRSGELATQAAGERACALAEANGGLQARAELLQQTCEHLRAQLAKSNECEEGLKELVSKLNAQLKRRLAEHELDQRAHQEQKRAGPDQPPPSRELLQLKAELQRRDEAKGLLEHRVEVAETEARLANDLVLQLEGELREERRKRQARELTQMRTLREEVVGRTSILPSRVALREFLQQRPVQLRAQDAAAVDIPPASAPGVERLRAQRTVGIGIPPEERVESEVGVGRERQPVMGGGRQPGGAPSPAASSNGRQSEPSPAASSYRRTANPSGSAIRHAQSEPSPAASLHRHTPSQSNPVASSYRHTPSEPNPAASLHRHTPSEPSPAVSSYRHIPSEPNPAASSHRHTPSQPSPAASSYRHTPTEPNPAASSHRHTPSQPSPAASSYRHTPSEPSPAVSSYRHTPSEPNPAASSHRHTPSDPQRAPSRYHHTPSQPNPTHSPYHHTNPNRNTPSNPRPTPPHPTPHHITRTTQAIRREFTSLANEVSDFTACGVDMLSVLCNAVLARTQRVVHDICSDADQGRARLTHLLDQETRRRADLEHSVRLLEQELRATPHVQHVPVARAPQHVHVYCRVDAVPDERSSLPADFTSTTAVRQEDLERVVSFPAQGSSEEALLVKTPLERRFAFDSVFRPEHSDEDVFHLLRPALTAQLASHAGSASNPPAHVVFCHGESCTSKSFTADAIVLRAMRFLLDERDEARAPGSMRVRLSVLEVYNNKLVDLLAPHQADTAPRLRIHVKGQFVDVDKANVVPVKDERSFLRLLRRAQGARSVDKSLRSRPPRSHVLFRILIDLNSRGQSVFEHDVLPSKPSSSSPPTTSPFAAHAGSSGSRRLQLTVVDLAGSERIAEEHCTDPRRKREAQHIRSSLETLGRVLQACARGPDAPTHDVSPSQSDDVEVARRFRECTLTRALQDHLCFDQRITLIAHVSPVRSEMYDTLDTLEFAEACRQQRVLSTPLTPDLLRTPPSTSPTRRRSRQRRSASSAKRVLSALPLLRADHGST